MGKAEKPTEMAPETVTVQDEKACHNCGRVNFRRTKTMLLEEFDKNAAINPDEYWKEAGEKGSIVYRHYREHSDGRCQHSC